MVVERAGLTWKMVTACTAYERQALPDTDAFYAVIITGSHDMVTDRDPWMLDLAEWIRDKVIGRVMLMSICFATS
jgi:GMP synthase (glutamine-hydrolysing)